MIGKSVIRSYHINQIDIITGFFYRVLDGKNYIIQPIMFEDARNQVCFLKKALYSLKQFFRV